MVARQLLDLQPFRFTFLVARSVPVGTPTRVPGFGVLRMRAVVDVATVVAHVRIDLSSARAARALRRMPQPISLSARAPMPDFALGEIAPRDAVLTVSGLVLRRNWMFWRRRRVTGVARTKQVAEVWAFEVVRRDGVAQAAPPGSG